MSFETESYKDLQTWEVITRLKKLGGDDLESLVKCGLDKMKAAVKLSVDSAENPYKKRYRFVSPIPGSLTPYVLYDRSSQLVDQLLE